MRKSISISIRVSEEELDKCWRYFSKKHCTFSYVGDLIPNGYIDTYMIPKFLKT